MDLGIKGKGALVLASSQGLGLGVAEALAAEGTNVVLCGRTTEKLAANVEAINGRGAGKADFVTIDLSDSDAAGKLHSAALEKLGSIDILVNNTGGPPPGITTDPTADVWRSQFDTMVVRLIELTNLCLPAMVDAGWGRILTLTSMGVQQPIPNLAISNTLRPALVGWSKTLATEVASHGVTSNILMPGRIDTERIGVLDRANAERQGRSLEDIRESSKKGIPVGRYGKVSEFAAVAAFLCSVPAAYVTGSSIRCDGGVIGHI